ncbi:hypothetical protein I5K81_31205, partial [Pseudomonas aeruginosa]|nr:hypothetical protein [Pseudomonas aeruginosa]
MRTGTHLHNLPQRAPACSPAPAHRGGALAGGGPGRPGGGGGGGPGAGGGGGRTGP